jgi:hypothetical protein
VCGAPREQSSNLNLSTFLIVKVNGGPRITCGRLSGPLMILYFPSLPAVKVSPTLPVILPSASAETA